MWSFPKRENSRPEAFCKKVVLKTFAIFTGKYLCWSLFSLRPSTFLKRDSNTGAFLITRFLRTSILKKICQWLLLKSEGTESAKLN